MDIEWWSTDGLVQEKVSILLFWFLFFFFSNSKPLLPLLERLCLHTRYASAHALYIICPRQPQKLQQPTGLGLQSSWDGKARHEIWLHNHWYQTNRLDCDLGFGSCPSCALVFLQGLSSHDVNNKRRSEKEEGNRNSIKNVIKRRQDNTAKFFCFLVLVDWWKETWQLILANHKQINYCDNLKFHSGSFLQCVARASSRELLKRVDRSSTTSRKEMIFHAEKNVSILQ